MRDPWLLPPSDDVLSPFTGWTRAHHLAVADGLLAAAQRYASPSHARITPPGPPSWSGPDSDGLEGFARTFLLLALRVAGEDGEDPADLLERYAAGLVAGVDGSHAEAWPRIAAQCRQAVVEAASVAIGLHLTRPWLWDRLADAHRQRVVNWLDGVFGLPLPDNNWHHFRVVVAAFLESVGAGRTVADAEADVRRIEELYVGDGWFRDGDGDRFDHYCGWAMHVYPVLVARMLGHDRVFPLARERLHRFLADLPLMVGADGAPLHQGRSLIYRMAAAAAPWSGALADATPLEPGLTRRIGSGMVRHFVDHRFVGPDGLPTLGWYAAHPPLVQPYSAPASPFWLAKGFLGLLLPAGHPVWTETEQALPVERADQVRALAAPGWVVAATHADGIARVLNHGSDNQPPLTGIEDPHYSRLAYSTATAPALPAPVPAAPVPAAPVPAAPTPDDTSTQAPELLDNHVGLVDAAGRVTRRTRIHRLGVSGRQAASWHEPMWPDGTPSGARIETVAAAVGPWEVRCHRVSGAPAGVLLLESGWQLAAASPPEDCPRGPAAVARTDRLTSVLLPLAGHDGVPRLMASEGTSAFGEYAATPVLTSALPPEAVGDAGAHVAVTLVGLGGPGLGLPDVACRVAGDEVHLSVGGEQVVVRLPRRDPAAG